MSPISRIISGCDNWLSQFLLTTFQCNGKSEYEKVKNINKGEARGKDGN